MLGLLVRRGNKEVKTHTSAFIISARGIFTAHECVSVTSECVLSQLYYYCYGGLKYVCHLCTDT